MKGGEKMNLAVSTVFNQPSYVRKAETGYSSDKFGEALSKSITAISKQKENNTEQVSKDEINQVSTIIDFLKQENVIDQDSLLEDSENLVESIQLLLEQLGEETEQVNSEDILQNMILLLEKLNDDKNLNFVKSELATLEPVLKFSKLYALLKENNSSFTENQESIQQLKQALEKLTAKLETLLTTMVKDSKGFSSVFIKQNQGDALSYLQGVYARTINGTTDKSVGLSENNPFMTMSKLEQFVLQTGTNRQEVSQEQFIKAFENIIGRSKLTNLNGMQKLFIKLNPESLGTLRIELIQRDGILMAKIIASTSGGKQLLDAQLHGLKQAFINQNISVEKIEIAYQSSELNQERHFNQDNMDNDESFTNQDESNIASETEQFLNELEKALTNQEEEV